MKVRVDEDLCRGCGQCEEICPAVFKVTDGISKVLVDVAPAEAEQACREAMENCPTEAISIEA